MKKYKRKPAQVEAIQWMKHGDCSLVIPPGGAIAWDFNNCTVMNNDKACGKLSREHGYINTVHGGRIICPGTWIVKRDDGVQVYNDKEFKQKYEAAQ